MAATTVLRWFRHRSDPPLVQSVIVETEEQLALRNLQRLEQAKQTLGERYLLHPDNKVSRVKEERSGALISRAGILGKTRVSKRGSPVDSHA
jgi:hypothetical protein